MDNYPTDEDANTDTPIDVPVDDTDPNSCMVVGQLLQKQGEKYYPQAIEKFKQASDLFSTIAPKSRKFPLRYWADTLRLQKQYTEAEAKYRNALFIDPKYAGAHYGLGLTLMAEGKERYAEATEHFKISNDIYVTRSPADCRYPLFGWAETLRLQERYPEAEAKYREVLRIDPNFPGACYGLALALKAQGEERYTEAAEKFKTVMDSSATLTPEERINSLFNWAEILRLQAQYPEAESKYFEVLRIDPNFAGACIGLGLALKSQGEERYMEAIEQFKSAIEFSSSLITEERINALFNWADILRLQEHYPEAEAKLREANLIAPNYASVYYVLGLTLKAQGEEHYAEAIEQFQTAMDLYAVQSPADRIHPLLNWAEILWLQKKYTEAEVKYREATLIDSENADAYRCLGLVLRAQGKEHYAEAIEQFKNAIDLYTTQSPEDCKYPLSDWADTLRMQEQFKEAESRYREVLGIDPNYAEACSGLGLALQGQGKEHYAEAIKQFQLANELFSSQSSEDRKYPLSNWADTLRLQEKYTEAEAKFREAMHIDPDYAAAHNGFGLTLKEQGEKHYTEAIKHFKIANDLYAKQSPDDGKYPLFNWADTLSLQEKYPEAEAKYREVLRIDPSYAEAYDGLGVALQEQGADFYLEAIEQFKKAIDLYSKLSPEDCKNPLSNWGDTLRYQERFTEAEAKYREALRIDPTFADAYDGLGLALQGQGKNRYTEAVEQFKTAIDLCAAQSPDDCKYPLSHWADTLRLQEQYPEAEEKYHEALRIDPDYAEGHDGLGLALLGQGKKYYSEAIEQFKIAIDLYAKQAPKERKYPLSNWADTLRYEEQYPEAEAKYREVLNIDPDYAEAYNGLGLALLGQGKEHYSEAIEQLQKGVSICKPLKIRNDLLLDLAWAYNSNEDYEDALKILEKAIADQPNNENLHFELGNTLANMSRYDDAIESFKEATHINPKAPFPLHNLAHYLFYLGKYKEGWSIWGRAKMAYSNLLNENSLRRIDTNHAFYFAYVLNNIYKDRDEAEKWYQRVLVKEPDSGRVLADLVSLYQNWVDVARPPSVIQGRLASAVNRCERVLKARLEQPDPWQSAVDLVDFYIECKDYENAERWLKFARRHCYELRTRQRIVNGRYGTLHAKCEKYEKAVEELNNFLHSSPEDLNIRTNLAEAYFKLEQYENAENEYTRVLRFAPGHLEALIGLSQLCIELGESGDSDRFVEAEQYLSLAIKHGVAERSGSKLLTGKERAQIHYLRGYARVKRYEANISSAFFLSNAKWDFTECKKLDSQGELGYKARSALSKIQSYTDKRKKEVVFEWIGPLLVCILSTLVFLIAQLKYYHVFDALYGNESGLSMDDLTYLTVTFGSLLFLVAGLYLPKILKLKVGTIELEKSTLPQFSSPSLGISR